MTYIKTQLQQIMLLNKKTNLITFYIVKRHLNISNSTLSYTN